MTRHRQGLAGFAAAVASAALALGAPAHARSDRAIDRGTDPTAGLPRPTGVSDFVDNQTLRANVLTRAARSAQAPPEPGFRLGPVARAQIVPQLGAAPQRERELAGTLAGERGIPNADVLTARGGGPVVPRVATADVGALGGRTRLPGTGPAVRTHESTLALPLGCSHIVAAGTPRVTDVALRIVDRHDRVVAEDLQRGRAAHLNFCPRDRGTYRLRVETRGSGGVIDSQVFLD